VLSLSWYQPELGNLHFNGAMGPSDIQSFSGAFDYIGLATLFVD
jgi:hypothetical protein